MIKNRKLKVGTTLLCFHIITVCGYGATSSPLFSRGYTVIPAPQKVPLGTNDFEFTRAWRLELGPGIKTDDIAVQSLKEQLQERFELTLGGSGTAAGVVHLAVAPNAVTVGAATDANKSALAEQAYRMELASDRVTITGNTPTGLFYGVQTLVQLLKPENGKLWLPEAQIEDWPDLELRVDLLGRRASPGASGCIEGGTAASIVLQDQRILDQAGRPFSISACSAYCRAVCVDPG